MRKKQLALAVALGILAMVFTACSFNLTTANIRSLKISSDEDGKKEASTFGPGEKVYVIADIGNNVGKVRVKFRVLYDDVEGRESGTPVGDEEKTLEVEGSRPAIFWVSLPATNFANGRYKAEVTMYAENGQQKGQQTSSFRVEGFTASNGTKSDDADDAAAAGEDNDEADTSGSENIEKVSSPPLAVDDPGNGNWRVYKGAWFEIKYPSAFQVRPSLRSSSAQGYDSVFFIAPGGDVEFYVFSPQWNGNPTDIAINPGSEVLVSQSSQKSGSRTVRRVTVKARDNSYSRSFEDTEDEATNTRKVFGIKYRDEGAYSRYRQTYLTFKQSLTQFAD